MNITIGKYSITIEKIALTPFSRSHLKRWAEQVEATHIVAQGTYPFNNVKIGRIRKARVFFESKYGWNAGTNPRFGLKEAKD